MPLPYDRRVPFQPVQEASATDLRGTKALLSFLLVSYTARLVLHAPYHFLAVLSFSLTLV
jgi:hypothetical protein